MATRATTSMAARLGRLRRASVERMPAETRGSADVAVGAAAVVVMIGSYQRGSADAAWREAIRRWAGARSVPARPQDRQLMRRGWVAAQGGSRRAFQNVSGSDHLELVRGNREAHLFKGRRFACRRIGCVQHEGCGRCDEEPLGHVGLLCG